MRSINTSAGEFRRRVISAALAVALCCGLGMGQSKNGRPELLAAFDSETGDVLNGIYKLGLRLKPVFDPRKDRFAIRVCSADPLPVALATAKGLPFLTTSRLEQIGIPKSRIYYLRQAGKCPIVTHDYALTEYWLVPENAEFPKFLEVSKAVHLSASEFTRAGSLPQTEFAEVRDYEPEKLTPRSYVDLLGNVVSQLRNNKDAVLIIHVPFYRYSRTTELTKRVNETLNYLKISGIANHRVYVKRIFAGHKLSPREAAPKYPDIILVGEN